MRGAQKEAKVSEMAAIEPFAKPLTKTVRKALAAFLVVLLLFANLLAAMLEKAGVYTSLLLEMVAYAAPVDGAGLLNTALHSIGRELVWKLVWR